jgi:hypothetical protein
VRRLRWPSCSFDYRCACYSLRHLKFSQTNNSYAIENTINQSGLSLGYESGVTDFDSYLASKPEHTSNAKGNEWFSRDFSKPVKGLSSKNNGQKLQGKKGGSKVANAKALGKNQQVGSFRSANAKGSAGKPGKKQKAAKNSAVAASTSAVAKSPIVTITYGFGALTSINGFVLWNDEYAGIGTTELWSSIDGEEYTLLSTIKPEPSKFAPPNKIVPYLAQVFSFDPTIMLFFKLMIYDCPKPSANRDSFRGCGIGEVAFSAVPSGPSQSPVVPVPAALPLLASAIGLFAWLGRRQQCRI